MIFSQRNPWSTARLALITALVSLENRRFNDPLIMGDAVLDGPWTGLEIDHDCRIITADPGNSSLIFPGNVALLHGDTGRTREGWHPYHDGIFGLQRAMTYAGNREWITVTSFQGAHRDLEALLCFGLLIEKDDHYANAEHAAGIDKIRAVFNRSARGRASGAVEMASQVRTTTDKLGRRNRSRFGLTHPALQRRAAQIAERAHVNMMWANKLGMFATQLIGDCEIIVDEVLLAIRQALRAPWMNGYVHGAQGRRLANARTEHWPLLTARMELIVVHPLVQKAQRAAERIRDAATSDTEEARRSHMEAAYRILLGLKLRLIIGDLQRVVGLMDRELIPGDAREYLRIAGTATMLRDPARWDMSIFGLEGELFAVARAAGEKDAETLKQTLRSIAQSLDAA